MTPRRSGQREKEEEAEQQVADLGLEATLAEEAVEALENVCLISAFLQ